MNNGRVLIVDDEKDLGLGLKKMFERHFPEHFFQFACGVDDGLTVIAKEEFFDVIITDMVMPRPANEMPDTISGADGVEGLEIVKSAIKRNPFTEVVVMTAYSKPENIVAALEAGAGQYIDKGMDSTEVIQCRVLEQRMSHVFRMKNALMHVGSNDGISPREGLDSVEQKLFHDFLLESGSPMSDLNQVLDTIDRSIVDICHKSNALRNEFEEAASNLRSVIQGFNRFYGRKLDQ